ncbi:MAG: hypothetical protein ABIQ95_03770 [Bdellovibrionia bacterium]
MKRNLRIHLTKILASSLLPALLTSFFSQTSHSKTNRRPSSSTDSSDVEPKKKSRSSEWKLLPKQKWEIFNTGLNKNISNAALDKDTKSNLKINAGFEPQAIPATDPIKPLGQIIGSRTESQYLFADDLVYIRSKGLIQVGDTYGITDAPDLLKSSKSDRTGYSYLILGKVKILAVRDDLFLGKVISVKSFIPRGTLLIPNPPKILDTLPINGPSAVQGTLIFDHRFSTFTSAQHKEVFIDRGNTDGLRPGMVFRVYQHYDPSNDKKISSSELIVDAELQVTQVSETFSTAVILVSNTPITESSSAILMTDVSELIKTEKHETRGAELDKVGQALPKDPLEELDNLDTLPSLGLGEKKKLHQLEKWQANPEGNSSKLVKPENTPSSDATTAIPSLDANSVPSTDSTTKNSADNNSANATPAEVPVSSVESTGLEVAPPPLLGDSPPPPPMVPVKDESAPLPPSAAATQDASSAPKTAPNSSSEPELPAPPLPVEP